MHSASFSDNDPLCHRAQQLIARGIQPYATSFTRSHLLCEINEENEGIGVEFPDKQGLFTVCGRIMSKTVCGEYLLVSIEDQDSTLQVILSADNLTKASINLFAFYVYRGDYLGFTLDYLYREQGRLTGIVKEWRFLALANMPFPRHMSIERQRAEQQLYLASSFKARESVIIRARMIRFIRQYLDEQGVLEVNTTRTQLIGVAQALLQFLIGGIEQVYEITTSGSAQPIDWMSHPQSLRLHCCMALSSPQAVMNMLEQMLHKLTQRIHSTSLLIWQPLNRLNYANDSESVEIADETQTLEIDMSTGWARRTLYQAIDDALRVDFTSLSSTEQVLKVLTQTGLQLDSMDSDIPVRVIAQQTFQQYVAPTLIQPTFIVYPVDPANPVECFELYINGILLAYGQREITDPLQHTAVLPEAGSELRDHLMLGMPPASSLTLNLDRLAMLMIGAADIRDMVCFGREVQ